MEKRVWLRVDGAYHSPPWKIVKDWAMVWDSSRPRKVVNWEVWKNGAKVKGYGFGEDTLAKAKALVENIERKQPVREES